MENAFNMMFSEDSLSKRAVSLSHLCSSRKPHIQAQKNAAPAFFIEDVLFRGKKKRLSGMKAWGLFARARKAAFTLIELLVYMVIMGFIIVVAGRVFSDSTAMRVRSQSMLVSSEEAGRVSALLKEDISQMGAKSWASGNEHEFKYAKNVQMSGTDLSSYQLERNKPPTEDKSFDSLSFRKVHYDNTGACVAVLEIEWYVKDSVLVRKCNKIADYDCTGGTLNEADCPKEVEMASGVTVFRFLPSKPGVSGSPPPGSDTLFAPTNDNFTFTEQGNNSQSPSKSIKGFKKNIAGSTPDPNEYLLVSGSQSAPCQDILFEKGEEYAIEFDLKIDTLDTDECLIGGTDACKGRVNKMIMFQVGYDHLSIGLRDPSGKPIGIIPEFLFYPPQEKGANAAVKRRHFTFSVPDSIKACIGITAALYSEAAEGHLDFSSFKVYRKTDRVYHFLDTLAPDYLTYNPPTNDNPPIEKSAVKAFKLEFGVKKKGELSHTITVIPVPSNGVAGGGS